MSEYRLVALDLDGTTLMPDGSLSPRMLQAVTRARARGVTVTLATARRWTGASGIAAELGHNGPLILYDGAIQRDFPDGATLIEHVLRPGVVQHVADILARHELQVVTQHSGSAERLIASASPRHPAWMQAYISAFPEQITQAPLNRIGEAYDGALRVVSIGPERRLMAAFEELATLPVGRQILAHGSYGSAELTVFSPEASKGAALAWLAARLDIPLTETLAMGDGVNDISMLRIAGLGVAMGNATADVKTAAKAVTRSNAQDGAALAIERYVLGEDAELEEAEATA